MNQANNAAAVWIESRDADSPAELQRHVRSAIALSRQAAVVDTLVDASVACLGSALRLGSDRAAAAELLAADALLTWACDAAAETADPDAFDALVGQVSSRLQLLLEESE